MRWLLRLLLDDADRRAIESDLAELYELRRRQHGEPAAAQWLRRQHLIYPAHVLLDRARAAVSASTASGSHAGRDAIYGLRSLARTPGLTATVVLTVGLGLGATTAMLSVVRAVLINPLPYDSSGDLFWIYTDNPPYRFRFSLVDYRALEADHPAFSDVAAYQTSTVTVLERDAARRLTAKAVTGSYFPLLRQRALIGRLFDQSDDGRGDRVAVLTAPYWRTQFRGDPSVLGTPIAISGTPHTIVGVLQDTDGPLERDVAMFTAARWPAPRRKGPFMLMVLGRLRADTPLPVAAQTLRATNARLFPIWKSSYQDEKATWGMVDLKTRVVGDVRAKVLLVLIAIGCVLLIACANAANLLIARALTRSRELAIRSALGASGGQLVQHLAIETLLLAGAATAVAFGIAQLAVNLVKAFGGSYIPRVGEVELSAPVLAWLACLAGGTAIVMFLGSAVPALQGARLRLDRALRAGGRSATVGRTAERLRRALVALEFALATPLLVAAVLVMSSLDRLSQVDVGIETARVLTASVSLSGPLYAQESDRAAFWRRALDRFASLPGVEAAAIADGRPPKDSGNNNNFDLEDRPTPPGQSQPVCPWIAVSPSFFKTAGLPLQHGRLLDDFSLRDNVVVVDRAWANRFFPGQHVVGRRLRSGGCTTCPWTTIVGVVDNMKWTGLETPEDGTVYWPFVDFPNAFVILRTSGDPAASVPSLRQAVKELDATLPLTNVATGSDLVSDSLTAPRYLSILIGVFALTALVLSVVGIYGVMAYFVQQHTRDIGIRLALGGEPGGVRRMIVLQGLRFVAAGIAVGLAASFLTARLLSTLLFAVSPTDPWTLSAVPAALLAIAALGIAIPSHRAANLEPAEILRDN